MKSFLIKVNGVAYEVEVEETTGSMAPAVPVAPAVAAVPAPVAARVPAATPALAAAPASPAPAATGKIGSAIVKAPMPGTILSILVNVGQAVEKNQILCILEAMKMENEIVSPRDGVIASINTSKGAAVNAGDLLISLA
jgi:biotin carboxyl carrier protein